jgi:hypothetical protein
MNVTKRVCRLDNDDRTPIILSIVSAQTIFDRSQITGDGDNTTPNTTVDDITYNLAYDNKLSSSDNLSDKIPANLVDDGYDGRFYPITEVVSILNKMSMVLYYDKKYNDFIFVPFLDKVTGSEIEIRTYAVRGMSSSIDSGDINSTKRLPALKNDSDDSDETTDTYIIDSRTHVFFDTYSGEPAQYKSGGVLLDSKYYTETSLTNVEEYVSLGNSADLFDTPPMSIRYLDNPLGYPAKASIKSDIDDVLIRIPF